MSRPVAVDLGFGRLKARDATKTLIEKAAVASAESLFATGGRPADAPPDLECDDIDGSWWMVGDLAARQSAHPIVSDIAERDQDRVARIQLRAMLAYLCSDGDESVNLVTGLPIDQYLTRRDEFAKWLCDDEGRRMTVCLTVNGKRTKRRVFIDRAKILPQGLGAYMRLVLNNRGEAENDPETPDIDRQRVSVIDVGAGTVNHLFIDQGEPRRQVARTMRGTYNEVYSRLAQANNSVPPAQIESEVLAGRLSADSEIHAMGERIGEWARALLNPTAFRPDVVLLCGAGAKAIAEPFTAHFRMGEQIVILDGLANVEGYYRAGLRPASWATS
jgi:hypothetical protein